MYLYIYIYICIYIFIYTSLDIKIYYLYLSPENSIKAKTFLCHLNLLLNQYILGGGGSSSLEG